MSQDPTPVARHHLPLPPEAASPDPTAALAAMRLPGAQPFPPGLLERAALPPPRLDHPFDEALAVEPFGAPGGAFLVFDLDDTILSCSFTNREDWDRTDPRPGTPTASGIAYRGMRRSLRGRLSGLRGAQRYDTYSKRRYPWMRNPRVTVQLRPGMLTLLRRLRERGDQLALVTACARQRVEFLFAKMPFLAECFTTPDGPAVLAAEDLVRAMRTHRLGLPDHPEEGSLSNKLPDFLAQALGWPRCDLLVDDSSATAAFFAARGESARLIAIERGAMHTPYVLEIARAIDARLTRASTGDPPALPEERISPRPGEFDHALSDYPFTRFEDPLYFPLLHRTDRFLLSLS